MNNPRRLAVITGASTGIGRSIAESLARNDWDIAFTFLDSKSQVQDADDIRSLGASVFAERCDAGIKAEVDRFFDAVVVWAGRAPSLLVNNAGIQTWSPLLDLQEADWDRVIRTNLKGCFLNTQAAARRMIAAGHGGAIVNIGSGCNKLAFPQLVDYTASKGGIEQFTKVAAVELGRHGIRVNCVAPGAIENERTLREASDYAAGWAALTPLGRTGRGADVSAAVLFLASEAASFITGQTLWVDGGVFSRAAWPY